ncbi:MAG: 3D domain-containing protein [Candidatus Moraniibacteriota bacterium]
MSLSIVTSSLGLSAMLLGASPAPVETNDAQTNTQININTSASFDSSLSLDALKKTNELEQIHQKLIALEQEKVSKKLTLWKGKQSSLWKSLPQGKFVINASAYTAAADECGKSDGITASGLKVTEHRTLACPPNFPFGAKIHIENMGDYTCEDRGGAIKDNHIDIYMQTKTEAFAFGRRQLMAEVIQ